MTTYTISLDDVDLALLPTRSYSNNFLKKDLFEFQLLTRDEEKDLPTYTNYPCHICAINVPAPYLNEHIASVKHQTNVRITTEASQRMRALITATPFPPTPPATERFCDSCTRIVGKDHEKSKEHRVSVIQDRMLCDLANLYIGDGDLDGVEETEKKNGLDNDKDKKQLNKDEDKIPTKDITKVDDVAKLANTTINETGQKQKAFKNKEIHNKPATEQEIPYGQSTEFVKFNVAMYIKILKKATSSPRIDIRPVGDKIYILINNERMIVSYDHFNSYFRMEDKVHCNLCNSSFDEAYEDVHKLTVNHVTSVMPVVGDSHCIREVHEWWSHCILCNEIVWNSDVEEHKVTQRHVEEKRMATVPQVQTENDQEQNINALANIPKVKLNNSNVPNQNLPHDDAKNIPEVKPKNVTVPNQNSQTRPAVNISELYAKTKIESNNDMSQSGDSQKLKLKDKNKSVPNQNQETIVSYVYIDSEGDNNYPFTEESDSNVRCVVCDCVVPSFYGNRVSHLNGNRHAANLKKQFPPIEQK